MSRHLRVIAISVCIALSACKRAPERPGVRELVDAVSLPTRYVEPRLSGGFRWAPFVSASAAGTPAIRSTAGYVLRDSASPQAIALAHLLTGNSEAAVERLESATRITPKNASYWSDLAAARYLFAIQKDKPSELPRALASADRALELDPEHLEAHFNRALILEKLGLRSFAAVQWAQYLARDRESKWAEEAQERFKRCRGREPNFAAALATACDSARQGDIAPLEQLVRSDPQTARMYGDGYILLPWLDGDGVPAGARALAAALITVSHDHFLADYIEAIDAGRARIDAFSEYVKGRKPYKDSKGGDAEPHFRAAAALGRGTPLENLALYYTASAAFDQDRIDECGALLQSVLSRTDEARHPGLVAQIEWQLGRVDAYHGQWSGSLSHLAHARTIFSRLNERRNVAFIDAIIAEAYDHMALTEQGWRFRVKALDVLSQRAISAEQVNTVVTGGIRAELFRRQYDSALALAELIVERLEHGRQPEILTEALIRRARVLQVAGTRESVAAAVERARKAAMTIADNAAREHALRETDVIEALNVRDQAPAVAVDLLSRVLAEYAGASESVWIPPLYLERGRAYRNLGRTEDALRDFRAAIKETETQRASVEAEDLRAFFFDTEPALIAEAADLLTRDDKVKEAFDLIERAHARTLIERLGIAAPNGAALPTIQRRLRSRELLIVYQLLPDALAVFAIDAQHVTFRRVNVSNEILRSVVRNMRQSIFSGASTDVARNRCADAYRILIAPIADRVANADRLVIVPDRFLYDVPYAALYDGRFLVETHDITISPGASLLLRDLAPLRLHPAFIVGDPDGSLPAARLEASRVAALYAPATLMTGNEATAESFIAAAQDAALIHYAGHAQLDDATQGLLQFRGNAPSDSLSSDEITKLRLKREPLVVLAACGTLIGSAEHVEGMPSVARAFLAAGARSVVGTLWDVPDEVSYELFDEFHRQLAISHDAAAALAASQRELVRRNGERSHPAFWAAAEVLGN